MSSQFDKKNQYMVSIWTYFYSTKLQLSMGTGSETQSALSSIYGYTS